MTESSRSGMQQVALLVTKLHLGDAAETVCSALIRRPNRSLKELHGDTGLSLGQLRNSLLVLIQQNLVTAAVEVGYGKINRENRYDVDIPEAVLRIRYPKFSAHVRSTLGEEAEKIMEAVLDNGRATWEQIRSFCATVLPNEPEENLVKAGDSLVHKKYLIRVVPAADKALEAAGAPVKKAATNTKAGKRKAAAQEEESRASKIRRLELGAEEDEGAVYESITNEGAIWRFNPHAFMWDFRCLAIEQLMADRYGPSTSSLINLLLKTVRLKSLQPVNVANNHIPAASVDALLREHKLSGEEHNTHRTWEATSEALSTLCQDSFKAVCKILGGGADGATFKPDIELLTCTLRQQIIDSVIEAKFGARARRIFRLIVERKYLESKTVWDLSMVPKKDANDLLCRMLKHQLLHMQEVPRSADHNAQRTFFLWFVDMKRVCRLLEDEMCRTLAHLLQKREEKRVECEEFLGVGGEVGDLTAIQLKRYQALEAAGEKLNSAILRLDETLMVLRDATALEEREEARWRTV